MVFKMTLKGAKTWKDIFSEAEAAHPNDNDAQAQYAADLMNSIGWDVTITPDDPNDKRVVRPRP